MGEFQAGPGERPRSDALRRALCWLGQQREAAPEANPGELVAEAALRFGLSPVEEECLIRAVWPAPEPT